VVAYAPTEGSSDPDKDQFYHQLSSVVQSISLPDELILLGDFNAVTGPRAQGFENVVGHFGFGTPNDNSARLLSFCSSHGLVIPLQGRGSSDLIFTDGPGSRMTAQQRRNSFNWTTSSPATSKSPSLIVYTGDWRHQPIPTITL